MNTFDIVTVGSCFVDLILRLDEKNPNYYLNEETGELCLKYGQKMHVEECDFFLGGNACNLAVGLSRFEFKTSIVAEIGDDEFAQKIVAGLKKEGVDLSYITQTKNAPSSFTVGLQYREDKTLLVRHVKRLHNFTFDNMQTPWVYLTSLAHEWTLAYQKTLEFVKNNNAKLVFNPGSSQFSSESEVFQEALQASNTLIVNKEEAMKILRAPFGVAKKDGDDMDKLIVHIRSLGPEIVVITDGVNGSFCGSGEKIYHIGSFPVSSDKVVSKTGAGDAYSTGFVAALMKGFSTLEAMRWGALNAASVIQKLGAQEGLLKTTELMEKLDNHPEFRAKELT